MQYMDDRDGAWRELLKHKVGSLPVKISDICRAEGITVLSYKNGAEIIEASRFAHSAETSDGFAAIIRRRKYIFYSEACSVERQRFTVAHEYGHYVRNHVTEAPTSRNREPGEEDDPLETDANIVASRILSPACVLWGLKVRSAEEISQLCDISAAAARWRMKRMLQLYERELDFLLERGQSCFLQSPLEREVFRQFGGYIKNQLQRRAGPSQ